MTNDEKYHSGDCENAHTDRCRCWCGGEFHGIRSGVYAKIEGKIIEPTIEGEKIMSKVDGGNVKKQIGELEGKMFRCVGPCNKPLTATPLWVRPTTQPIWVQRAEGSREGGKGSYRGILLATRANPVDARDGVRGGVEGDGWSASFERVGRHAHQHLP